ncbi:MAG: M42 family peptidase [Chloroflexota bacterium]
MDLLSLISTLTETSGISGQENRIRDLVKSTWLPYVDEVKVDTLGNVIATKFGSGEEPRDRVMLAAHMDEIGLMVSRIRGSFLSVVPVGGVDLRLLLGQPIMVHGQRELPGVVGSRPPHILSKGERNKSVPFEDLVVDTGLEEEEVNKLVRVGDMVSFRQPMVKLMGDRFGGKALDNRLSVAAIAACLEEMQTRTHVWDIVAVATVQEAVTMRGATTGAYGVNPTIGIAVDVTFGKGPGVDASESFELGKGPTIGYGPNNHPAVHQALVVAAKAIELPHHIEAMPRGSGTDAWAMEVTRAGLPTGVVSIPIRNMHMPVEIASLKDVERCGRLIAEFIANLDANFKTGKLIWNDGETEEKQA